MRLSPAHIVYRLLVAAVLGLLFAHSSYSQTPEPWEINAQRKDSAFAWKNRYDPRYIRPAVRGLMIRFYESSYQMGMEIKHNIPQYPSIRYKPNPFTSAGIQMSYNGFTVGFTQKVADSGLDPSRYGRTKFTSLDLLFTNRRWGGQLYYHTMKGFYLDNPGSFVIPNIPAMPPAVRNDMVLGEVGFDYYRVFSRFRFSYRAMMQQSDLQLRSAGSMLLRLHVGQLAFAADSSLVPGNLVRQLVALNSFRSARFTFFSLSPGYAHAFSIGKEINITPMALIGPALQSQRYFNENGPLKTRPAIGIEGRFRLLLSYNARVFFIGLSFTSEGISNRYHKISFTNTSQDFNVFIGFRVPSVHLFKNWKALHRIGPVRRILEPIPGTPIDSRTGKRIEERTRRGVR